MRKHDAALVYVRPVFQGKLVAEVVAEGPAPHLVTCQIGDDVPYLIKSCMGENTLMIGTDYGHADSSTELDALTTLKDAGGISAEQHRKIVEDNPRAFYGLA